MLTCSYSLDTLYAGPWYFLSLKLMFEDTMLNVRMWSNLKNFKETLQKNHDPYLN